MEEDNMSNFVYLLQEREFIKTKEPIYKIGMTTKTDLSRIKTYPKGSILLFYSICNNCKTMETELIELFKIYFIHRKDIGSEYFEGDYKDMIHFCYQTLFDENSECDGEQTVSSNTNIELENIKEQKESYKEYNCPHCKKQYAAYKSLCNHNKNEMLLPQNQCKLPNSLICKYCNRCFNHRNNRLQHEKRCKVKKDIEHAKQEKEIQQALDRGLEEKRLDIELKKREAEVLRLQMRIQKESEILEDTSEYSKGNHV